MMMMWFYADKRAISVVRALLLRCTQNNTHKLRQINDFNVVILGNNKHNLRAPSQLAFQSGSEFLLHREAALPCHTAFHAAEGHGFYVPCMQLVNFVYFVVWVCMCVRQPNEVAASRCFLHWDRFRNSRESNVMWDVPLSLDLRLVTLYLVCPRSYSQTLH